MKKTIITSALALMSMSAFADTSIPDVKSQMKVTANVAAGCFLEADNINFGVLQMPLSEQIASADMRILCSNKAIYSLNINYGNSSSSGSPYSYTISSTGVSSGFTHQQIKVYKSNQGVTGDRHDIQCWGNYPNQVYFYTSYATAMNLPRGYQNDIWGICSNTENLISDTGFQSFFGYEFSGSLIGITSKEKVIFNILNPENNDNWTQSYSKTGTGTEQIVPLKAKIDIKSSPTHRLTPDTYQSSVSIQISY